MTWRVIRDSTRSWEPPAGTGAGPPYVANDSAFQRSERCDACLPIGPGCSRSACSRGARVSAAAALKNNRRDQPALRCRLRHPRRHRRRPRDCAPSPPPITCPNGEGFGFTVIELYEEANVCRARTNGSEKFTTLRTAWSNFANWDICNRCSTAVDVRLRNWDPGEPPQRNFLYTNPMWDSSNTIEVHTVCPQKHGDITGLLKDGAGEPDFKSIDYQTSWRVSGQLACNDIDPRLEIERDGGMLFQKLLQFWKMPGQRGRGR